MENLTLDQLAAQAKEADRLGRTQEAAKFWGEFARKAPSHPSVQFFLGRQALDRGDPLAALPFLERAQANDPQNAEAHLFAALANNLLGQLPAALACLDQALVLNPYDFVAMLSRGKVLERMGRSRDAASVYRNVIKIAPPEDRLSPQLRDGLHQAHLAVAKDANEKAAFLRDQTTAARARHSGADLRRFDECLEILAGTKRRQMHDPILLYYPQLPPLPFYDRSHFPWLPDLEAATNVIREELASLLSEANEGFEPYIQYPPGAPVNQWRDLNHSKAWSTFFLWRDGKQHSANCEKCPKTTALLQSLPLARQEGYGPTAMFSALAPRTTIPPHTGSSNARLIVHLPLILPANCGFRVGNETREWRMSEAWVFDDSIEHEAWNRSDQVRAILIFDVWNPLLSSAEQDMVESLMTALNTYAAGEAPNAYSMQ